MLLSELLWIFDLLEAQATEAGQRSVMRSMVVVWPLEGVSLRTSRCLHISVSIALNGGHYLTLLDIRNSLVPLA